MLGPSAFPSVLKSATLLGLTFGIFTQSWANDRPTPEKCENMWTQMLSKSRPGDFDTYRITTRTQSPQFNQEVISLVKTTVKEVKTDRLVTVVETTMNDRTMPPAQAILDKSKFVEGCLMGMGQQVNYEVVEEGRSEVSVPAGAFSCTYQKIKFKMPQGTSFTTSYAAQLPSGYTLLVKSSTEMDMMGRMKSTTLKELVEYRH